MAPSAALCALAGLAAAQNPAANIDQIRNGSAASPDCPPQWTNGNAGETNAHFTEGMSQSYRVLMTGLDNYIGSYIELVLEYDVKHSGHHAVDYVTSFQRLEPHIGFGHDTELIDPRRDNMGVLIPALAGAPIEGHDTCSILPPNVSILVDLDGDGVPETEQPATSFLALAGETILVDDDCDPGTPGVVMDSRVMTIYNGAFTSDSDGIDDDGDGVADDADEQPFAYDVEGSLTEEKSSTSFKVRFLPTQSTVAIAWGGHLGSRNDWGFANGDPLSAGGIEGSPYHMRLLGWNLGSLGNQDLSLKAAAVFTFCPCELTGPTGPVCPNGDPLEYQGSAEPGTTYKWTVTGDAFIIGPDDEQTVLVQPTGACGGSFTIALASGCSGGIADSCELTVPLQDTVAPEITCPGDAAFECDETIVFGEASATDNCDPAPKITFDDVITPGACAQAMTIERTWTATDACGNTATCVQTISIVDTTPPEITCPPGATFECDDTIFFGNATATDNCDPEPEITFEDKTTPGACAHSQTIERTWTATDACGNATSCVQTISIVDVTAPVISCPPNDTFECGDTVVFGQATATDNCDPSPKITFDDETTPGDCPQEMTIQRTWTATDACGNSNSCVQTISVVDTTPPDLVCPGNATFECGETVVFGEATATDNCDPDPEVTFDDVTTPGDCPQAMTIERTWTATDACGNSKSCVQTISIVDSTPPLILCPSNATFECDEAVEFGEASATDNCDPEPVITFVDDLKDGDCPQAMVIERTWTATDACGNSASCVQKVSIVDTTPPDLVCPVNETFECDETIDFGEASATDNCDPAPKITFDDETKPGDCPQEMTIERTWTATDACGNSKSCVQTISIVDTTPPVLSCPSDSSGLECGAPNKFCISATDNCDPEPDISVEITDVDPPGSVALVDLGDGCFTLSSPTFSSATVTVTATDGCGNSDSCTFPVGFECIECRMTGGGNGTTAGVDQWTCGGQAGAPSLADPFPCGEWSHRQHKGPSGKFTFHAGTHSAPAGTRVDYVVCSDPPACAPAHNPGPAKQVDFGGIGSFKNVLDGPLVGAVQPGISLHWFDVHHEDLGEPGSPPPGPQCPPEGSAGSSADCSCPDYYRIVIHATEDPGSAVIYEAFGYLRGGNSQIHDVTGGGACSSPASGFAGGGLAIPGGLASAERAGGGTASESGDAGRVELAPWSAPGVRPGQPDARDGLQGFQLPPSMLVNDGWLAPGLYACPLVLPGDFTQTDRGVLWVGVEPEPFCPYVPIVIGQNALLDGILLVEFARGYQPQLGDRFAILEAAVLSGSFDRVIAAPWQPLPAGLALAVTVEAETAILSVVRSQQ